MANHARKISEWVVLLAVCIALVSCSARPELPKEAKEALENYWQSLPSAGKVEYRIVQSWPGTTSSEDTAPWPPSMEIWCVEAENASDHESETMIWFVARQSEDSAWDAALLMTMSSIWPYEACGAAP